MRLEIYESDELKWSFPIPDIDTSDIDMFHRGEYITREVNKRHRDVILACTNQLQRAKVYLVFQSKMNEEIIAG
jgi:hypothetical protein